MPDELDGEVNELCDSLEGECAAPVAEECVEETWRFALRRAYTVQESLQPELDRLMLADWQRRIEAGASPGDVQDAQDLVRGATHCLGNAIAEIERVPARVGRDDIGEVLDDLRAAMALVTQGIEYCKRLEVLRRRIFGQPA